MADPAPKLAPLCPIGILVVVAESWPCRPAAGTDQAVRDVHKGEKTEAAGIQFQFWVADGDSTSNTFPFENKQKMM